MKFKLLFVYLVYTMSVMANQPLNDTINQTDKNGMKQGYWEKQYENGKPIYKGYFKNNKPVGEMMRFYESGAVKAIIKFHEDSPMSQIRFYYENENKAADGFYLNNKKDSVWNYYSYYDKLLKLQERYTNNVKNGKSYIFYSTGNIFDETNWVNGKKHGLWKQYYTNGNQQLVATYINDQLEGDFTILFKNGKREIGGYHVNNLKHGKWLYFNEDGETLLELNYDNGALLNKEALSEHEKEFFDKMEEDIGKFKEPNLENFLGR